MPVLNILVLDTVYWRIALAAGLGKRCESQGERAALIRAFLESSPSSGVGLAQALRSRGHEVKLHMANVPGFASWNKSKKSDRRERVEIFFWKNWQWISRIPVIGGLLFSKSPMAKELLAAASGSSFDLVYVLNPNLTVPSVSKELRRLSICMVGQIASPLPPRRFFRGYRLMISAHPGQVEFFRRIGIDAKLIPLSIDEAVMPGRFKPHAEREIAICFVGNFSRHHRQGTKLIQKLCAEFPELRIFSLSSNSRIRQLGLLNHFSGSVWGKEMMQRYSNSKIVINRHGKVAAGFAVNYRMYEAAGSGAVLLTEEAPNLSELFRSGEEIETYRNFEELRNKLREYLSHPKRAEEVGLAGFEAVKSRHTSRIRHAQVAEILEKLV